MSFDLAQLDYSFQDEQSRWPYVQLRRVLRGITSGTSVNAEDTPVDEGQIGVLKTSCVYTGQFDPTHNKAVIPDEIDRVSCPLKAGRLVVSRMNTPDLVGAAGLVRDDTPNLFLPDRLWLVELADAEPAYFYWWTQTPSYRDQVKQACAGTSSSMQNLSLDEFRSFQCPVPPIPEQRAIAAFLDRETAKLDALIEEQRRLIALLKEKRQAVISHAVTRGLDPTAPLKPSGIDWLGDIPAHWEVAPLKRGIVTISQGWSPQCDSRPAEAEETGVLKVGCVNGGIFRREENKALPKDMEPREGLELCEGDLLISRANTRNLVGSAAVVPHDEPNLLLCDKLYRLRLDPERLNPNFVSLQLGTPMAREVIELSATGASASMLNIGQATITELRLPMPPKPEQDRIVAHVVEEAGRFNALTAEATRAIALLQERRAALISAAVTGKIDVREATHEAAKYMVDA